MALQPRFGQSLSEKISPLYYILSKVCPVMDPKGSVVAVHAIHLPGFRYSLVLYAFRPSVEYLRHLLSCAQRSCLTPYRVRNCICSCTHRLSFVCWSSALLLLLLPLVLDKQREWCLIKSASLHGLLNGESERVYNDKWQTWVINRPKLRDVTYGWAFSWKFH
jgi:hypothetical protein